MADLFNDTEQFVHDCLNYAAMWNISVHQSTAAGSLLFYFILSVLGINANVLLLVAIRYRVGFFGDRQTFTLLVSVLNVLDLALCLTLPVELLLTSQEVSMYQYEFLLHCRNALLLMEVATLLFMAVDRYLAISWPLTDLWNYTRVQRLLTAVAVILGGLELGCLIVMIQPSDTFCRGSIYSLYEIAVVLYSLICLLCVCLLYTLLGLQHCRHQHRLNRHREAMQMRVLHSDSGNSQPRTSRINSSLSQDQAFPMLHDPTNSSIITATASSRRPVPLVRRATSWRLLRVLAVVTGLHLMSKLPHFLTTFWEVFHFSYFIHLSYYLNAVINPFLYAINDHVLRQFAWNLCPCFYPLHHTPQPPVNSRGERSRVSTL